MRESAPHGANSSGREMNYMEIVAKGCESLACLFLGALGVIVLVKMFTDKIDLEWLVSEDNGHVSLIAIPRTRYSTNSTIYSA